MLCTLAVAFMIKTVAAINGPLKLSPQIVIIFLAERKLYFCFFKKFIVLKTTIIKMSF